MKTMKEIPLSERLKLYMAERDLTCEKVGIQINRSTQTIHNIIRGKNIAFRTEYRIKKLLGEI